MLKLPRVGTKSLSILMYIGTHQNVRHRDISRFVCELSGLDYDKMECANIWANAGKPNQKMVRVNRGYWQTNLFHGPKSLMRKYCVKLADGSWSLTSDAAEAMVNMFEAMYFSSQVYVAGLPFRNLKETSVQNDFTETAKTVPDGSVEQTFTSKPSIQDAISKLQNIRDEVWQVGQDLDVLRSKYEKLLQTETDAADMVRELLNL